VEGSLRQLAGIRVADDARRNRVAIASQRHAGHDRYSRWDRDIDRNNARRRNVLPTRGQHQRHCDDTCIRATLQLNCRCGRGVGRHGKRQRPAAA
jgi:hypothetical protein